MTFGGFTGMGLTSRKTIVASGALALACGVCMASPALAQEQETKGAAAKADRLPAPGAVQKGSTLLDRITISATMVKEAVIDALAGISTVDDEELQRIQPDTAADIFRATPGVAASMNGDDPATAINIRGLEQYGRKDKFPLNLPPCFPLSGAPEGRSLSSLLANGELDAVISDTSPGWYVRWDSSALIESFWLEETPGQQTNVVAVAQLDQDCLRLTDTTPEAVLRSRLHMDLKGFKRFCEETR